MVFATRTRVVDDDLVALLRIGAESEADERVDLREIIRGALRAGEDQRERLVRIVREIAEFDRLAAGEVLVAPYTNPAWTPLFQRAAAVIVDTGSPVSHAAIVAREYGIPAVMATLTGTHTLQDGERVRVDGSQGVVYRASSQAAASEG